MEKYIIIKELPDAPVGTEVIWDESTNAFYYEKSCYVTPHKRNYLSAGQVTQTPEYFCKEQEYPEYYAYKHPVYSIEEILELLKYAFPNSSKISTSKEFMSFKDLLRILGKSNAERIIGTLKK